VWYFWVYDVIYSIFPPCFTTSNISAQTIPPPIISEADGGWITLLHVHLIKEPVVIFCFKYSKNDKIKFITRRFEFHQMPILNFWQPATKQIWTHFHIKFCCPVLFHWTTRPIIYLFAYLVAFDNNYDTEVRSEISCRDIVP